MKGTFNVFTDGMYLFCETEDPNVFLFWREDERRLEKEEAITVFKDMFDWYLSYQLNTGKISFEQLQIRMFIKLAEDQKVAKMIIC